MLLLCEYVCACVCFHSPLVCPQACEEGGGGGGLHWMNVNAPDLHTKGEKHKQNHQLLCRAAAPHLSKNICTVTPHPLTVNRR